MKPPPATATVPRGGEKRPQQPKWSLDDHEKMGIHKRKTRKEMGINIANGDMIFQRENGIYGFVMMIYVSSWGLNPKGVNMHCVGKIIGKHRGIQPTQSGG